MAPANRVKGVVKAIEISAPGRIVEQVWEIGTRMGMRIFEERQRIGTKQAATALEYICKPIKSKVVECLCNSR